jgi:hypothetical protein
VTAYNDLGFSLFFFWGGGEWWGAVGNFAKLRMATFTFVVSVRPSVRMEQLGPMGRIFKMKFDI